MNVGEILRLFYRILEFQLFQLKDTPVTIASLIMLIIVIVIFILISKMTRNIFLNQIFTRLRLDEGTAFTLTRVTHYLIMLMGCIVAFQFVGIDLSGLMVIFGALSVGIGFGLQNLTLNFISGLILLVERPIRVGDRVTVGEIEGDVIEINIRSTIIRSLNNISIIVPNSEFMSAQVINWSHGELKIRIDIDVGVSYSSDLDAVLQCLNEVAQESKDVLKKPPHEVLHMGFGDSAWDMRIRAWISNPKRHNYIRSDLHCAIIKKFRYHDIEIPFPQRDLNLRSPLPLPVSSAVPETGNQ